MRREDLGGIWSWELNGRVELRMIPVVFGLEWLELLPSVEIDIRGEGGA